jgi:hypothetical protein
VNWPLELLTWDVISFSVLFELVHGHKDTHLIEKGLLFDLIDHLNKFLLMEEIFDKLSGWMELSTGKVWLFNWFCTSFHGCELVWSKNALACHPLHELSVINFSLTFDHEVVIKTFLGSG